MGERKIYREREETDRQINRRPADRQTDGETDRERV